MAGLSLLVLLDDIVAVLDDVALMSKIAAKKTAGVLGDDLALNAQQVSGVKAEREIPVVWAVAKGSLLNKAIIVPIVLILNAFLPIAIVILLLMGGLYLCFEGFEKIVHSLFDSDHVIKNKKQRVQANADVNIDLVLVEKNKIKGAIRTDFILSAEVIVIALSSISEANFLTQILTLIAISLGLTIFVYGFVAAIVKMDDLGFYLISKSENNIQSMNYRLGKFLIAFAPILMKLLIIIGTIAMFLVGGSLIEHNVPFIHNLISHIEQYILHFSNLFENIIPTLLTGLVGFIAGAICFLIVKSFSFFNKVFNKPE